MYLSELLVCNNGDCYAPQIRCKNCFRKVHAGHDETTGERKVHPHQPFDESFLFKNFLQLMKVLEIIERRMKTSFGEFISSTDYLSNLAFFGGSEIQESFPTQELIHQLSVLK